ncbi:hypothetical protein A2U01_0034318 [Trifolium medium]|uniref:Uncharacterized protein n=1 Tax=Trifolium medium TaxID=97028 RepID=A0A392PN46_9FABA|nr:hypothetical protein [Trifolium medium]
MCCGEVVVVSLYLVDLYHVSVDGLEAIFELRLICLVSSDISMGRVDVLSGGLEADECLSKNEIRIRPLLDSVCFDIFIGVPLIYGTFVL